jgi:hypothetical protein
LAAREGKKGGEEENNKEGKYADERRPPREEEIPRANAFRDGGLRRRIVATKRVRFDLSPFIRSTSLHWRCESPGGIMAIRDIPPIKRNES